MGCVKITYTRLHCYAGQLVISYFKTFLEIRFFQCLNSCKGDITIFAIDCALGKDERVKIHSSLPVSNWHLCLPRQAKLLLGQQCCCGQQKLGRLQTTTGHWCNFIAMDVENKDSCVILKSQSDLFEKVCYNFRSLVPSGCSMSFFQLYIMIIPCLTEIQNWLWY